MRSHRARARTMERGQVMIFVALMLPVILTLGSVVVSAGNWYVLKRHLQTQVDAAALAGGPSFTGCGQDPVSANVRIAQDALGYSGDTLRSGAPYNLQLEQSGDQRVVLNSGAYWSPGDPTDGSTLDNTQGLPCDAKFLDVKATDEDAPLLVRWIPLFPDLKTRALVEIHKVEGTNGLRPLGVPEVDPKKVAVLFVNEDAPGGVNSPAAIVGKSFVDFWNPKLPSPPPSELAGMSVWHKDVTGVNFNGSSNYSAVVLASRDPAVSLTSGNGSLQAVCNQNPTQTHCYGPGTTLQQGISFIHSYSGATSGHADAPAIRSVELDGGCGTVVSLAYASNPYFNVDDGNNCATIPIRAVIDFGVTGDPTSPASPNLCAVVPGYTWSAGGIGGALGTWNGSITPAVASGRNVVDIDWNTKKSGNGCGNKKYSGTLNKVAVPYVADDDSGPVQYIRLDNLTSPGGLVNSVNGNGTTTNVRVTVGLTPPLQDAKPGDPPVPLRFWDTPSQSQALDCANGASGWNNAMVNGCPDPYQIYDQAKHVSACGNPPPGVPAADPADCISSKNGNFQQKAVTDLLTPCSANPNRWDPTGATVPPAWDKRWMPLFIVDELAFTQSGKKTYPIRRFGMFYVTAVSGLNCPGDNPSPAPSGKRSMFGYFFSYVTPGFGDTIADDELCSFTDGGLCVSGLVE